MSETASFIANISDQNEVKILHLTGSLEAKWQKELQEELEKRSHKERDLVLDLEKVSFIDSSCLGTLVAVVRNLRDQKGDIKLCCLNDDVRSIFQITRLERIFELYDSIDEAVQSYYR